METGESKGVSTQTFSADGRLHSAHRNGRADKASGGTFHRSLKSNLAPMPW